MLNGLIPISTEEYKEYIQSCKDFYYRLDINDGASFAFRTDSDLLVAYQDKNGDCFSRTVYWRVTNEPK